MMHCDRCNIDFPEGLRYCKWCGQTLNVHTRSTGEIQTCPACFSAVQSSWAFCKACGARLTGQAQEPLSAVCPRCSAVTDPGALNCLRCGEDLTQGHAPARPAHGEVTAVFAHCPTCGEAVESGSMYCKACGSALYSQPSPFGASALLCSVCQSYSPVGSTVCRVCGAALKSNQSTGDFATEKERSSTLPDLADHFPVEAGEQPTAPESPVESGAHTLNFIGETQVIDSGQSPAAREDDIPTTAIQPKRGAETTVLPGVAGSKAESVGLTSTMQRPRITSPVEGEKEEQAPETATETAATPVASDSPPTPFSGLVTRVDIPSSFYFDNDEASGSREAETAADEFVSAPPSDSSSTVVFGSGAEAPSAFENEDYRATASWKDQTTISGEEVLRDEVTTAPFGLEEPAADRTGATVPQAGTIGLESVSASAQPEIEAAGRPGDLKARSANTADFAAKPEPWTPVAEHTAQPDLPTAPVAQPEKRSGAMIASVIVVVLVLAATGFAVWWYVLGGSKPAPPTTQTVTETPPTTQPTAPPAPPAPSAPSAPEGMMMVAGGTYLIGRDNGNTLEGPQQPVELKSFYVDRTEVTNADYKKFVDATGHQPPSNWVDGIYPEGRDTYPVTGVTWQDAADYAQWAGKRLPTEAEWEAAARGSDGRMYPWGNEWRDGLTNIGVKTSTRYEAKQYPSEIASAGRFLDGASPVGALDLIGNVWEWTADTFELYPGSRATIPDDVRNDPQKFRVIRGGAFDGDKRHDAAYRGYLEAGQPYPKVGFRCVKDAK